MAQHVIQTSFAAGELSPTLFARVDLEKYHSGAALLRNWYVDYRGGANTRPGTQFVGEAPAKSRLVPFIVSTIATYVLVFSEHEIRFISDGVYLIDSGTMLPLVITSPYAAADLPLIKYAQSADVLTLTHPAYPIYNLTRTSPTAFSLDLDVIGPKISAPLTPGVMSVNNTANKYTYGYIVTAIGANGEESLPSSPGFVDTDILNQNAGIMNTIQWSPVVGASSYRIYKTGPTASGALGENTSTPVGTFYGLIGESNTSVFVDNNIAQDPSQTPPQFTDPFTPGQIAEVRGTLPGMGYVGEVFELVFTGDGTGAAGYGICDHTTGEFAGAILTNPGKGYTYCTVSDTDANTTVYSVTIGQQSGTYPACVGYFQQRRVFGGTTNFPESMVFSQPGAYNNFNTSPISQASDSITVSLASRQVNAIKSMTAMSTGLIVLTTGGGFLVSGGSADAAFTPTSVVAFPQASSGCNDLPPLVINYDVLYAQNRGAVVRDLAFNFYVQSYTGTDRSVLASHLFTGHELLEWTYAEEPFRQVQVIREDGVLLSFTYVPEQEIYAWTHADTHGYFRSIASIPEGETNTVYVIVERYVNGSWRFYVERFTSGIFSTLEDSWCLDCALATPNITPHANITISGVMGTVTVSADAGVFSSGNTGSTLWALDGYGTATYVDAHTLTVVVIKPFHATFDASDGTPIQVASGSWFLNPNVTTVSGLNHLEGMSVVATADGTPVYNLTVQSGSVTLPEPASRIIVGLPFSCQLQTLKIDLGDPTAQGSRKLIAAVTARVNQSLGLKVGPTFDKLTDMKELLPANPPYLKSADARTIISGFWNKDGQICFQQDAPWPASVLGVIPEVVRGDTQR